MKLKLFFAVVFASLQSFALSNSVAAEETGWQSVAFIKVPFVETDGSIGLGHCNAALINDRTLLTAAHCVQNSALNRGHKLEVQLGDYHYIIKDGVKKKIGYKVKITHLSSVVIKVLPGTNLDSTSTIPPQLDIAFLKLDQPINVPSDFVFAELWNQSLPQLTSAHRPTLVSINYAETVTHMDTRQKALLNNFSMSGPVMYSTSTSRVAPGDSGAPLFAMINNKTYLIGVVKGTVRQFMTERDVLVTLQGRMQP